MLKDKGAEVLRNLRPNGGWVITDSDFESIQWVDCEPITKAEFDAEFEIVEQKFMEKIQEKAIEKAALLSKLGITEDEAKLLLS